MTRRVPRLVLGASLLSLVLAREGIAACRWVYLEGRPQQNCDNPLDPPATNLPRLAPAPLPGPPLAGMPSLPAPGSTGCAQNPQLLGCH